MCPGTNSAACVTKVTKRTHCDKKPVRAEILELVHGIG